MRLGVFPVGDALVASTRFRILAFLPYLQKEGFEIHLRFPKIFRPSQAMSRVWNMAADVCAAASFDAVLLHGKCYPPAAARWLHGRAPRMVFDFDDAVWMPPAGHPHERSAWRRVRYERNFEATVRGTSAAVAGNDYLAAKAREYVKDVECIPTGLDTALWTPFPRRVDRGGPVLGWVGHPGNLPDLEALTPALRKFRERHSGMRLRVVSSQAPAMEGVPVEFEPWSLAREREAFEGIDIGLMPLADGPWARGKCAFKGVQFMACGIPVVASPTGENGRLIAHGENGLLASTSGEWVEKLALLAEDGALRERLAQRGRETVEERYSVEKLALKWINLLRRVMESTP